MLGSVNQPGSEGDRRHSQRKRAFSSGFLGKLALPGGGFACDFRRHHRDPDEWGKWNLTKVPNETIYSFK
jgi:hypothetical protein